MIWNMFTNAIMERPVFGFGFGRSAVISAQLLEAEKYPEVHVSFFYSHNIFLDIFLWVGVPIGVVIIFFLAKWIIDIFLRAKTPFQGMGFAMLLVVLIHGMVEYPLYYLYFLLPFGIILGALDRSLKKEKKNVIFEICPKTVLILLSLAVGLIFFLARDYLLVEEVNASLSLEASGIRERGASKLPFLYILNQFEAEYELRRILPKKNMSKDEILRLEEALKINPSHLAFWKMAEVYALNNMPIRAREALAVMCKVSSKSQCSRGLEKWDDLQKIHSEFQLSK